MTARIIIKYLTDYSIIIANSYMSFGMPVVTAILNRLFIYAQAIDISVYNLQGGCCFKYIKVTSCDLNT